MCTLGYQVHASSHQIAIAKFSWGQYFFLCCHDDARLHKNSPLASSMPVGRRLRFGTISPQWQRPVPSLLHHPDSMFGIGYDNMDQSQGHIGCDLLDIGSRRAAARGRCAHQSEGSEEVPTLKLGEPGAFDLPNVPDVSQVQDCVGKFLLGWLYCRLWALG